MAIKRKTAKKSAPAKRAKTSKTGSARKAKKVTAKRSPGIDFGGITKRKLSSFSTGLHVAAYTSTTSAMPTFTCIC